jgi:hypothetical protein
MGGTAFLSCFRRQLNPIVVTTWMAYAALGPGYDVVPFSAAEKKRQQALIVVLYLSTFWSA